MAWRDELWEIVAREWSVGERFTLDEVYKFEPHFQKKYPYNRHVREKLRQQLQELRDEGRLSFEDDHGTYRRRV